RAPGPAVAPPPRPAPPPAAAIAVPRPPAAPVERPLDYDAVRKDAQTTLRAALRETEPAVRVQGSDALGKIKDQPSTPALSQVTETDGDAEVRGHAADALGAIGAPVAPLLARLEAAAPPPLQVWYASALARLGDKAAAKRLLGHARSKDLAIAFKAAITLAELGQPGDKKVLAALRALATHEAELSSVAPYAGALILSRMAALRDAPARKLLYALLDHRDEGARLAAAEGLARIGDDAGKQVLHDVAASPASPNQLVAAVAQIPLGEYGGFDLIAAQLTAKDPETRRLAARALGEIGERKSLRALIAAASDRDWTVRIAAAGAIVAIVGLDPQVLAQASVDWTRSALGSQDWAVRKAAAGVLADIPESQAVPLLAQAIADPDPGVRLAASRSAGKMKSADAAARVVAAVKTETDARVKEQQVKALGEIASPTAHDTLAQIAEEAGRIGVLAAGSLIAVGDPSGKAKLDAAVVDKDSDLRLAAVEAASTANNPVVIPTLQVGILDRVFAIRFAAAEALAALHDKVSALPVLNEALGSKDADVFGRAVAALTRLGEKLRDKLQSPADLVDSPDPRQRLAAVSVVRALPPDEAVPLLRRLVADLDADVRHAAVDAVETVAANDKDAAIKLYKPLVNDADPVVRSKAAGQLARLVPPPPAIAAAPPAPAPATAPATPAAPPPDDKLPKVQLALDDATAAAAEVKTADEAFAATAAELATAIAAPARDATAVPHIEALATRLDDAAGKLEAAATRVEAAAQAASAAAGDSPSADAARLVADARALVQRARDAATGARGKTTEAAAQARSYVQRETGDPQFYIAAADAAIASGNLAEARHKLDTAAQLLHKSGTRRPGLDQSYGQLYDGMARRAGDPATRRKLLEQAEDAYRRFVAAGTGPLVQRASDRLAEIAEELKELGTP
ncbi:MAG TPA: HEAT repeat domain-containing protein, partial [Kofleriaceae bacterium]|nr:HEAT repeat domain-containing protein [Kofleriaceae bacterium]